MPSAPTLNVGTVGTLAPARALNFSAGPAALPLPALERAREELLDFAGTGMSVMEQSHRGKAYDAVHHEALGLLRELLGVPASHDVLFLQGGATQQFAEVPLNFLPAGRSADYIVTGAWGEKAVSEGKPVAALGGGTVRVAATTGVAKAGGAGELAYTRVPVASELSLNPQAAYLHFTSNETIHGVEYAVDPARPFPTAPAGVPLICDMSSDFLWRPIDVSAFDFIYAGAQKNIGPSGVVVVVARKAFLDTGRKDLPKIFQYRAHAANDSLYNTPATFGIYLTRNVLAWAKGLGGLDALERRNRQKAALLYGALDRHGDFYRCPVERESRSVMNVVFRLPTEALEEQLVTEAKRAHRIAGIAGHRSVGGLRVSLYNAISVEDVQTLVGFLEFVRTRG